MTLPRDEIVQMTYQNPHATAPLYLPVKVVCNTDDAELRRHIELNSRRPLQWVSAVAPHGRIAVMVGGGPSLVDHIDTIRDMQAAGAAVFAMNGASRFIRHLGIRVDHQVIVDAKAETAALIDTGARETLVASQAHPDTVDAASRVRLWHLGIDGMETLFPAERVKAGNYVMIGGGAAVGNCALCLAFAMGYRAFHLFGYDSCHQGRRSHAYSQPMNEFIPSLDVEWAGRTYHASVAMKAQAEKFQITAAALKAEGCTFTLYGEGLLQAMYQTPPENLSERDKYRRMWQSEGYREVSPGERAVDAILPLIKPGDLVIDFGCGTGRAALTVAKAGHPVLLIDFADNCRDAEAQALPFLEWDLTRPIPVRAQWGICCDVMEHIPPADVEVVIRNVMASADRCFFQISTVPDAWGAVIGSTLHLSVHPAEWWRETFVRMGFAVEGEAVGPIEARFIIAPSQTGH